VAYDDSDFHQMLTQMNMRLDGEPSNVFSKNEGGLLAVLGRCNDHRAYNWLVCTASTT
jgi:hypothetical protein